MKKLYLAAMFFCLSFLPARLAPAQYIPGYPYAPYGYGAPYDDSQYYDPYAELHTLHYQLYLPPAYPYYYCCASTVIVPPAPPIIVPPFRPAPRAVVPNAPRR